MPGPDNHLDCFEHVVVLMLENRSFDNLLGYLYSANPGDGRRFDGLRGEHEDKDLRNPIPRDAPVPDPPNRGDTKTDIVAKRVSDDGVPGSEYHVPNPDPGESYPHVNTQIFFPCEEGASERENPDPHHPECDVTMRGFVADYVENYRRTAGKGADPTYQQYRRIMECFPPERVPVLSQLAREFAVFDHWHCSVPSQTWCNRAFWHAATSYGRVINGPSLKWLCGSKAPNLFTRLVDRFGDPRSRKHPADKTAWRIYSPWTNFVSLTMILHLRALHRYYDEHHVRDMCHFYDDCANGELPRYTFIEPLFLFQHNDQHPSSVTGLIDAETHVGSVLLGEHLILRVYQAIKESNSRNGNNAGNTLLIITHDEHGGCYDHVAPGPAVPPRGRLKPGQDKFTFNRLGVRVPMVMISAHIEPGTIVNSCHDHTSFLRTMEKKWGLQHLTERDRAATPFNDVFNRATPRDPGDWPSPVAPPLPDGWKTNAGFAAEGLHGMQRDLLHAAALRHGLPRRHVEQLATLGEAHDMLSRQMFARGGRTRSPWRMLLSLLFS